MTAPNPESGDWVLGWIDGQRSLVEEWLKVQGEPGSGGQRPFASLFEQLDRAAPGIGSLGDRFASLWRGIGPAVPGSQGLPELPGLGPLREQQEILQDLAAAVLEYQRLSADMATILAKVHSDTLDLLARRTVELANSGLPLENTRALYDLWVECGEATYGKIAAGEAYCRLQADLCNAGIRVQSRQQQLLERWLKQLDLPTRSELNTLHRRVQELKLRLDAQATASGKPPTGATRRPRTARRKS